MKNRILFAGLFVLLALGCQQDEDFIPTPADQHNAVLAVKSEITTVEIGEPFVMSPGDVVRVLPDGFNVYFNSVVEDSRCPSTVTCIWEGRAIAEFAFEYLDEYFEVNLATPNSIVRPDSYAIAFSRTFRLLEVAPYPRQPHQVIPQKSYRIKVVVERGFTNGQDD